MAAIDNGQIERIARLINHIPREEKDRLNFNFYSEKTGKGEIVLSGLFPSLYHPQAANFFLFLCMNDYGFWHGNESGYAESLYGYIGGKKVKGSDLLTMAFKKFLDADEEAFEPSRLAGMSPAELAYEVFAADNGPIDFPDIEERCFTAIAYGEYFVRERISPAGILEKANSKDASLKSFLGETRRIPGYDLDPLQKKNLLAAMIFANRPEQFLRVNDPRNWMPIVDYHLMRISLRLGIVKLDDEERTVNEKRLWVNEAQEWSIRLSVCQAIDALIRKTGLPMVVVDQLLWNARSYCPEMVVPDCEQCVFSSFCEKRTDLFQPVIRTTFY